MKISRHIVPAILLALAAFLAAQIVRDKDEQARAALDEDGRFRATEPNSIFNTGGGTRLVDETLITSLLIEGHL